MSTGNFAKDFPVAIGIAAGATIGLLILVCVAAHFGPRMCRLDRKERWLAPDVEKSALHSGGNIPLMMGHRRATESTTPELFGTQSTRRAVGNNSTELRHVDGWTVQCSFIQTTKIKKELITNTYLAKMPLIEAILAVHAFVAPPNRIEPSRGQLRSPRNGRQQILLPEKRRAHTNKTTTLREETIVPRSAHGPSPKLKTNTDLIPSVPIPATST
ncbi:hypothetical protein CHU98_g7590 [Xylaria longipes]|nr:hypothetical protein CHU98_g7590 [Xylaria longipes]